MDLTGSTKVKMTNKMKTLASQGIKSIIKWYKMKSNIPPTRDMNPILNKKSQITVLTNIIIRIQAKIVKIEVEIQVQ